MAGVPRSSPLPNPSAVVAAIAEKVRGRFPAWAVQPATREDPSTEDTLRPGAKLYLAAVTLVALAAAYVALVRANPTRPDDLNLAFALVAAVALGSLLPLTFAAKLKLDLDTAALVAAVLLFEPGIALLVVGSGRALAHLLRRKPVEQTVFNTAQAVLQAAAGGGLLAVTGWRVEQLRLDHLGAVLLAGGVGVGLWLLAALLVTPMVALETGRSLPHVWLQMVSSDRRLDVLAELPQIAAGVVVAGVASAHSWLAAVLLLPLGAGAPALAHHTRRRRQAEARLVHQAFHDPLTGLPNRTLFFQRLEQALQRAARSGETVAVLFVDLDRFKFVNDSLGHAAGDELLVALGERLRSCVRPVDTVSRLGGDEFTVLLEGLRDGDAAERIADGIGAALNLPIPLDGHEATVTASIGIALAGPGQTTATDLLRDADVALYRSKEQGKARWTVFDSAMGAGRRERIALEVQLRRGIARGEFRLAFQPLVELATGRVTGVEALVRWQHPTRGLVPPDAFIPLAEETGLILPIGRWVLEEACRHGRVWQERYPSAPVVSVNLSACQFQQPDLVEDIAHALRVTGFDSHHLKLEITESAMMTDADAAVATLWRLKDLGVRIAIDDFGTGYSSLGRLQRFPVDLLKVDKAFIAGLGHQTGDAAIVRAVVGLARALGLGVVAEGVETPAQLSWLRDLGCDLGQGFYFGPPVPAAAISALLDKDAAGSLELASAD